MICGDTAYTLPKHSCTGKLVIVALSGQPPGFNELCVCVLYVYCSFSPACIGIVPMSIGYNGFEYWSLSTILHNVDVFFVAQRTPQQWFALFVSRKFRILQRVACVTSNLSSYRPWYGPILQCRSTVLLQLIIVVCLLWMETLGTVYEMCWIVYFVELQRKDFWSRKFLGIPFTTFVSRQR